MGTRWDAKLQKCSRLINTHGQWSSCACLQPELKLARNRSTAGRIRMAKICVIASMNRYTICIRFDSYRICLFIYSSWEFYFALASINGIQQQRTLCKWKREQETELTECVSISKKNNWLVHCLQCSAGNGVYTRSTYPHHWQPLRPTSHSLICCSRLPSLYCM